MEYSHLKAYVVKKIKLLSKQVIPFINQTKGEIIKVKNCKMKKISQCLYR